MLEIRAGGIHRLMEVGAMTALLLYVSKVIRFGYKPVSTLVDLHWQRE